MVSLLIPRLGLSRLADIRELFEKSPRGVSTPSLLEGSQILMV